jgi:hypothetical protein
LADDLSLVAEVYEDTDGACFPQRVLSGFMSISDSCYVSVSQYTCNILCQRARSMVVSSSSACALKMAM